MATKINWNQIYGVIWVQKKKKKKKGKKDTISRIKTAQENPAQAYRADE